MTLPTRKVLLRKFHEYNRRRRNHGLTPVSREEYEAVVKTRYERAKAMSYAAVKASSLGILTPKKVNYMENDDVNVHTLDMIVRQEGGGGVSPKIGWIAIGNGGLWKVKSRRDQ